MITPKIIVIIPGNFAIGHIIYGMAIAWLWYGGHVIQPGFFTEFYLGYSHELSKIFYHKFKKLWAQFGDTG